MYLQKHDFGAAQRAYADALAKKEAALGRHHPEYAATLAQLAEVMRLQGRLDDAAALLRESAEVLDAVGAGHTRAATARLVRLAVVLAEAGKFADAVAVHRRLLQSAENAAEPSPAALAQAQCGLADALCRTGRLDEARALYVQSAALLDGMRSERGCVSAAAVRRRLAEAELTDGSAASLDAAEALLTAALPVLQAAASKAAEAAHVRAESSPAVPPSLHGMQAAVRRRDLSLTSAHASAALEMAAVWAALAQLHARRGRRDAARDAARAVEEHLAAVPPGAARDAVTAKLRLVP